MFSRFDYIVSFAFCDTSYRLRNFHTPSTLKERHTGKRTRPSFQGSPFDYTISQTLPKETVAFLPKFWQLTFLTHLKPISMQSWQLAGLFLVHDVVALQSLIEMFLPHQQKLFKYHISKLHKMQSR